MGPRIARVLSVFTALAGVLLGIVVLFGPSTIEGSEVEPKVVEVFTDRGLPAPEVSCDDLLGDVGETTDCTATAGGERVAVLVRVTSVDGDRVRFEVAPQR